MLISGRLIFETWIITSCQSNLNLEQKKTRQLRKCPQKGNTLEFMSPHSFSLGPTMPLNSIASGILGPHDYIKPS